MSTKMHQRNRSVKKDSSKIYMDLKEILREHALRYLPAKTLLRSLTVCREWKLRISFPFFAHEQSVSFGSFSGIFYQKRGMPPSLISLDQSAYGVPDAGLNFLPEPVDIRASANGLICCQGRSGERPYYVCNPVNQHWKKLPKPTADHGPEPVVALVFEPSRLNFVPAFKLVCVFASMDMDQAYEFEIYSSVQDSWKISAEMYFSKAPITQFSQPICVNGVVHWSFGYGTVLSFDMKTEKARTISHGYGYGYGGSSPLLRLGTMNGNLCSTSVGKDNHVIVTELLSTHANTMPSHSSRKVNQVHTCVLSADIVRHEDQVKPLLLLTWDGIVVFQNRLKFFSHDLKTQTTTALQGSEQVDIQTAVFPYVNSLVNLS